MNDFVSRSELSPVDRVTARAPSAVASVQIADMQDRKAQAQPPSAAPAPAPAVRDMVSPDRPDDEQIASVAEFVSVHARIAGILAGIRADSTSAEAAVDGAAAAIQSMIPAPIIIVPLPPASKEQVEHAALLAQRMAQQASKAHAAQAHLRPGTVDMALSAVV